MAASGLTIQGFAAGFAGKASGQNGRPEDRKAFDYSNSGLLGQYSLIGGRQTPRFARGLDQVRPVLCGDSQALIAPPALNLRMVPR
jgi:hypothetical protein